MRPLDSASCLPNMTEDFADVTLWHSCLPWYRPLRPPTTRQLNNEFKNSMCDIWLAWLPLCFEITIHGQRQHTAGCIRYKWETRKLEKSALLGNALIGAGQNRWWTVKCCRGWGRSFENCRGHSEEINIDFHWLRGSTETLVGWCHTIGEQCICEWKPIWTHKRTGPGSPQLHETWPCGYQIIFSLTNIMRKEKIAIMIGKWF